MENTLENKYKFLCLYAGKGVLFCSGLPSISVTNNNNYERYKNIHAELRTLSSITDEEAFGVLKIALIEDHLNVSSIITEYNSTTIIHSNSTMRTVFDWNDMFWGVNTSNSVEMLYTVIDYLRKKGFAVPYDGMDVVEQIKRGWVKLK